jgi:hypothetical protein
MSPDIVNGLFEFCGALAIARSCWLLYKAKQVRGVSIWSTTFFFSWGAWNLWYYPSLEQVWSFRGGVCIMLANVAWISMAVFYSRRERRQALLDNVSWAV